MGPEASSGIGIFRRVRNARLLVAAAILVAGAAPAAFSQDAADTHTLPGASEQGGSAQQPSANPPPAQTEKERLAVNPITGMVTSPGAKYVPLTGQERWSLYWKQNYLSFGAYFSPVMTSLVLDQARGEPKEWGGGFGGYGKRLASRIGSNIIQGTVQAPVAAILHEDVRYIASSQRGAGRRILHALVYSFMTYNARGRPTPNFALLGGYYASTAISTTWLPGQRSVARYTFSNGTEQIALSIPVNLVQEFWSEIAGKFRRGK